MWAPSAVAHRAVAGAIRAAGSTLASRESSGRRAAFTLARVRDRGSLAQILYWAHKGRLIAFDGAHAERAGWVPVESSHLRHRCERDSVRRASWRPLGASSHPLNPNHAGPVLIIAATLSFSIGFWNF